MDLVLFKPEEIDKIWPLVKDKVQAALDRNHNFRNHTDVKKNCKNGVEQLWVIADKKDNVHGVCITQILQQPNYNVGLVRIATGHDLPLWVDKINEFENWAKKEFSCKKIEIYGRPGWKKMLTPLGY